MTAGSLKQWQVVVIGIVQGLDAGRMVGTITIRDGTGRSLLLVKDVPQGPDAVVKGLNRYR